MRKTARIALAAYDNVPLGADDSTQVLPLPFENSGENTPSVYEDPLYNAETIAETAEVAVEGFDQLLRIRKVLIAEGERGISIPCAEIMEISVESLCNRLGIEAAYSFPALEAYDNIHTKQAATSISLEEIVETIKLVWEKIVIIFKQLWKNISDFFGKLMGTAEKAQRGHAIQVTKTEIAELKKEETVAQQHQASPNHAPVAVAATQVVPENNAFIHSRELMTAFYAENVGSSAESVKLMLGDTIEFAKFINKVSAAYVDYLEKLLEVIDKYDAAVASQSSAETLIQHQNDMAEVINGSLTAAIETTFRQHNRSDVTAEQVKIVADSYKAETALVSNQLPQDIRFVFLKLRTPENAVFYKALKISPTMDPVPSDTTMIMPTVADMEVINNLRAELLKQWEISGETYQKTHVNLVEKILKKVNHTRETIRVDPAASAEWKDAMLNMTNRRVRLIQDFFNGYASLFGQGFSTTYGVYRLSGRLLDIVIRYHKTRLNRK